MDINEIISKWVREARTHAGYSQEAMGAKLALEMGTARGHTKGNISHWEKAKHSPSIHQLMAISKITKYQLPPEVLQGLSVKASPVNTLEQGIAPYQPVAANQDVATVEELMRMMNGFAAATAKERKLMLATADVALERARRKTNKAAT